MLNSKEQNNRINSFGIWRVIFTFVIIIFHTVGGGDFYDKYPMIHYHWYIAVEFFFVLSGYLLMQHIKNNPEETTWQYTAGRFIRLFPEYFVICLIRAIMVNGSDGPVMFCYKILINWREFFMLQGVGTNTFPFLNNPGWYVSVLIICSHLIYYMLRNHRKAFLEFVGPIIVIVSFSYMYRTYGSLENFYETKDIFMNTGIIRGLMAMTLGVFANETAQKIRPALTKLKSVLLFVFELVLYLFVIVFSALTPDATHDFLFLFVFFLAVICSGVNNIAVGLCNSAIVKFLDELSYTMYLSHFAVFGLVGLFYGSGTWEWIQLPIVLVSVILVSIIIHYPVKYLMKKITHREIRDK